VVQLVVQLVEQLVELPAAHQVEVQVVHLLVELQAVVLQEVHLLDLVVLLLAVLLAAELQEMHPLVVLALEEAAVVVPLDQTALHRPAPEETQMAHNLAAVRALEEAVVVAVLSDPMAWHLQVPGETQMVMAHKVEVHKQDWVKVAWHQTDPQEVVPLELPSQLAPAVVQGRAAPALDVHPALLSDLTEWLQLVPGETLTEMAPKEQAYKLSEK